MLNSIQENILPDVVIITLTENIQLKDLPLCNDDYTEILMQ